MTRAFFGGALVSPVLTAHPTEVQRKSILDAEHEIAMLLFERDLPLTPRERTGNDELLHAWVVMLWPTRFHHIQAGMQKSFDKNTSTKDDRTVRSTSAVIFVQQAAQIHDDRLPLSLMSVLLVGAE